ncbi:MAG TPA: class I SAM-dependent methyltransferase [Candidatus Saccharimonadales bacterium]|nr:class I SAM-dependent methyltransferase [Candidatus Saccharimonadales bacterium]
MASNAEIVATDLSQPMLDFAAAKRSTSSVLWRQADAQALPFDDAAFDIVVCQFGVMFFPDKAKGFDEARRILKPGGHFLFVVWDSFERNELPRTSAEAIATMFQDDPPTFVRRVPYGYNDEPTIRTQLRDARFNDVAVDRVAITLNVPGAREYAIGAVQGGPARNEIEQRDPTALGRATEVATLAIAKHFGPGPFKAASQALFVTAS